MYWVIFFLYVLIIRNIISYILLIVLVVVAFILFCIWTLVFYLLINYFISCTGWLLLCSLLKMYCVTSFYYIGIKYLVCLIFGSNFQFGIKVHCLFIYFFYLWFIYFARTFLCYYFVFFFLIQKYFFPNLILEVPFHDKLQFHLVF